MTTLTIQAIGDCYNHLEAHGELDIGAYLNGLHQSSPKISNGHTDHSLLNPMLQAAGDSCSSSLDLSNKALSTDSVRHLQLSTNNTLSYDKSQPNVSIVESEFYLEHPQQNPVIILGEGHCDYFRSNVSTIEDGSYSSYFRYEVAKVMANCHVPLKFFHRYKTLGMPALRQKSQHKGFALYLLCKVIHDCASLGQLHGIPVIITRNYGFLDTNLQQLIII